MRIQKQGLLIRGIWRPISELDLYMQESEKYHKLVELAKKENEARSFIKSAAQERSKILGITEKYRK